MTYNSLDDFQCNYRDGFRDGEEDKRDGTEYGDRMLPVGVDNNGGYRSCLRFVGYSLGYEAGWENDEEITDDDLWEKAREAYYP